MLGGGLLKPFGDFKAEWTEFKAQGIGTTMFPPSNASYVPPAIEVPVEAPIVIAVEPVAVEVIPDVPVVEVPSTADMIVEAVDDIPVVEASIEPEPVADPTSFASRRRGQLVQSLRAQLRAVPPDSRRGVQLRNQIARLLQEAI